MVEMFFEIGGAVFSLIVSYLGLFELMFVMRTLIHWAFKHEGNLNETQRLGDLSELQGKLRDALQKAETNEITAGTNAMQDGVLYKDGFRIDPLQQATIPATGEVPTWKHRRMELEAELARQMKIEEETLKQLKIAESQLETAKLQTQLPENTEQDVDHVKLKDAEKHEASADELKRLAVELGIEAVARQINEENKRLAEENARTVLETDRELEAKRRQLEEEENHKEATANAQKLLEVERQVEEKQRKTEEEEAQRETAANIRKLLEAEWALEAEEPKVTRDTIQMKHHGQDLKDKDDFEAKERKQRLIQENARRFLEAEQEMIELQQRMNLDSAPQTPVVEELCIKMTASLLTSESDNNREKLPTHKVKTQIGQSSQEPYSVTTKSLLFPGVSDDGSSIDPESSKQSSFSTQPSEEITTGTEDATRMMEKQFPQIERQDPDGEDNMPGLQYSDDYLRSLDGIKHRPLVREDGSGRRRAFKKRRSSGSSNSSRDSRTSREEELKMFTSLEEEEMQDEHDGDYAPIKYTGEQTLKVKSHHRRHKRSPAKDMMPTAMDSQRTSLEMLGEEGVNPWGEGLPGHYKDTAFWKREKAISIDEEDIEVEKSNETEGQGDKLDAATINPTTTTFEEATQVQNQQALSTLKNILSKESGDKELTSIAENFTDQGDAKPNLQTSIITERTSVSPARSSPRLRRSPRIDEMDQYAERWQETTIASGAPATQPDVVVTPTVTIQRALDNAPWRDEHGLLMQGLSDFYDFSSSINPSRSRPTSRNPSPTKSTSNSPQPRNVSYIPAKDLQLVDAYDDTRNHLDSCINIEAIVNLIEPSNFENTAGMEYREENTNQFVDSLLNVSDSPERKLEDDDAVRDKEISSLLQTLRTGRARSRSRSPLPTARNLQHSLQARRTKLIQQNDDILEKLNTARETKMLSESESGDSSTPKSPIDITISDENFTPEGAQSRSRSLSPFPTAANIQRSLDTRRSKLIQHNDEVFENLEAEQRRIKSNLQVGSETCTLTQSDSCTISVEFSDAANVAVTEAMECTNKDITIEADSLHLREFKSRSKSPLKGPTLKCMNLKKSDELDESDIIYETFTPDEEILAYSYLDRPNREPNFENIDLPTCKLYDNLNDLYDLNMWLNLEGSHNKTLSKNSEELESILAERQRLLDKEALHQLKNPTEEVELRMLSPTMEESSKIHSTAIELPVLQVFDSEHEKTSVVNDQSEQMPSSPDDQYFGDTNSPDLDSSQNNKIFRRIGFKRSTYVGESMEVDSDFDQFRREAAHFRRSRTPSRSVDERDVDSTLRTAAERRELQNFILAELTGETNNSGAVSGADSDEHGAKPKTQRTPSTEIERSVSKELLEGERMREEYLRSNFKRSTYVGQSIDMSEQYEGLRMEMATLRRTYSKSRSPSPINLSELNEGLRNEMASLQRSRSKSRSQPPIIVEQSSMASSTAPMRRDMQDKVHDELSQSVANFQDFSLYLNADFLDNDRRASDSVLMQKPETLLQFQDNDSDAILEPEEYHHFRRFSLNQEQPIEEYPNDDYVYVSQIEVRTSTGTRTWFREDFYSRNLEDLIEERSDAEAAVADDVPPAREEEYTDGSEDERQTVVEVDDEIDTDICDFNERGPADESHHEQSECEEAEREMDPYANHEAQDWQEVEPVDAVLNYVFVAAHPEEIPEEEGAVGGEGKHGGSADDSDSITIDQIYDEAIKNRKQSGILRDYDSILQEMQKNFVENSGDRTIDQDAYALWAKSRELERVSSQTSRINEGEVSTTFLESERRDKELRYLGDANLIARQSARLRSRFGYIPVVQGTDDDEVDLNYKPKKEYNWRKNFKLDDDNGENNAGEENVNAEREYFLIESEGPTAQYFDERKFSLGGESITLFSRSPEREILEPVPEHMADASDDAHPYSKQESISTDVGEKLKKKKSKKKTRKETKNYVAQADRDEDDSENQMESRRNSSAQMETDSPKRKSRSRRSSRSSTANDDPTPLYSPRSSVGISEPIADICEEYTEPMTTIKKKVKKRKRATETQAARSEIMPELESKEAAAEIQCTSTFNATEKSEKVTIFGGIAPSVSTTISPVDDASHIRPTEKSTTADTTVPMATNPPANVSATAATVDTFDILKDANFYPLF